MSTMTPHVRVLRAEAAALTAQGMISVAAAQVALEKGNTQLATIESTAGLLMARLSEAKLGAADAIEVEEREREGKVLT